MRFLVFLVVLIGLGLRYLVLAQDVPENILRKNIYAPNESIEILLATNCKQNLKWMASITGGRLEIFDQKTKSWHKGPTLWNSANVREDKLILRVVGINNKKTSLVLKFQNIQTGRVIEFGPIEFWVSDAYQDYIKAVNENILGE